MHIFFDPEKDATNLNKHGFSLAAGAGGRLGVPLLSPPYPAIALLQLMELKLLLARYFVFSRIKPEKSNIAMEGPAFRLLRNGLPHNCTAASCIRPDRALPPECWPEVWVCCRSRSRSRSSSTGWRRWPPRFPAPTASPKPSGTRSGGEMAQREIQPC
jgi:hypothetical protein